MDMVTMEMNKSGKITLFFKWIKKEHLYSICLIIKNVSFVAFFSCKIMLRTKHENQGKHYLLFRATGNNLFSHFSWENKEFV